VPALDAAEKDPSSTVTKRTVTRSSSTTRASKVGTITIIRYHLFLHATMHATCCLILYVCVKIPCEDYIYFILPVAFEFTQAILMVCLHKE